MSRRAGKKHENAAQSAFEATQEAFNTFFKRQYKKRWRKLRNSLLEPPRHVALANRYADPAFLNPNLPNPIPGFVPAGIVAQPLPPSFESKEAEHSLRSLRDELRVHCYYLLDAASLLPVQALQLQPGDSVCDMCAAPGGKSVAILQSLNLAKGKSSSGISAAPSLVCNEPSNERRQRLQTVVLDFLPPELQGCVRVMGRDGAKW